MIRLRVVGGALSAILFLVAAGCSPSSPEEPVLNFARLARVQVGADSVSASQDLLEFKQEVDDRREDREIHLEQDHKIDRAREDLVEARKANEGLVEAIETIDDALEGLRSDAEQRRNGAFAGFATNVVSSLAGIPAQWTAGISAGVSSWVRGDDLLSTVLQVGLNYGGTLAALEVSEAIAPPGSESGETKSLGEKLFGRPEGRDLVAEGAGDAIRSLMQAGSEEMARVERWRRLGPAPVAAAVGRQGTGTGPPPAPSRGRPLHVTDRPSPVSFTGRLGVREPPIDETVGRTLARPGPDAPVITPDLILSVIVDASERDYRNRLARALSSRDASRDRRLVLLSQRGELRAIRDALDETIEFGELLFEEYQAVQEVYKTASEELADQGGGWLGGLVRTLTGIGGSMLGGPVLGAFVAGGVGAAMNGADPEDVLNAAAASAGYVVGSIALRHAMDELWVGADDALQSKDSVFTPIARVASLSDDELRTSVFGVPRDPRPDPTLMASAPDHAPSSRPPSESAPRGRGAGFPAPPPPEAPPVEEGIRSVMAPWEFVGGVGGAKVIGAGVRRLGSRAVPWARRHWCKVMLAVNLVVANGQAPDCKPKVRPAGQAVRDQRAKDLLQRSQDAATRLRNTRQSRPVNPPKH